MAYSDLRDFIQRLEKEGELKRISIEVDPVLEIAEFADRSVKSGGPLASNVSRASPTSRALPTARPSG